MLVATLFFFVLKILLLLTSMIGTSKDNFVTFEDNFVTFEDNFVTSKDTFVTFGDKTVLFSKN